MTAYYRVQMRLETDTLLPSDTVTNTLYFMSDAASANTDDTGEASDFLRTFSTALEGRYASELLTGNIEHVWYDLEDPEPRVPIDTETDTITLTATGALPSEVAACLSYYGVFTSGVNKASRRGRIYVGPTVAAATTVSGGRVLWSSATLTAYANAMDALASSVGATNGVRMMTYSPTLHAVSGIAIATSVVVGGWVDNAPDTQRRRGTDATTRTSWTV